jgi:hypothetical protein
MPLEGQITRIRFHPAPLSGQENAGIRTIRRATPTATLHPRRFGIVPRCGPASTSMYWRSPRCGSPMVSLRPCRKGNRPHPSGFLPKTAANRLPLPCGKLPRHAIGRLDWLRFQSLLIYRLFGPLPLFRLPKLRFGHFRHRAPPAMSFRGINRPWRWTKIGAAFPHKEGIGFSIELKAIPLDGRLVALPPDTDDSNGRNGK